MFLENLVTDAVEPQRLGRFWEAALGGEQLTDEYEGYETRLTVADGPVLDLGFQRVPQPPPSGAPRGRPRTPSTRGSEVGKGWPVRNATADGSSFPSMDRRKSATSRRLSRRPGVASSRRPRRAKSAKRVTPPF